MMINVKYCGGCNPRYERSNIVKSLRERFPDIDIHFDYTDEAEAAVIICGCSAACADVSGYLGSYGRFIIWKESAKEELFGFLEDIERKRKED